MKPSASFLNRVAALALLPLVAVPSCFGWGREGHMMINRLAAEALPVDMPTFLRTAAAVNEIEYLAPEPTAGARPPNPS